MKWLFAERGKVIKSSQRTISFQFSLCSFSQQSSMEVPQALAFDYLVVAQLMDVNTDLRASLQHFLFCKHLFAAAADAHVLFICATHQWLVIGAHWNTEENMLDPISLLLKILSQLHMFTRKDATIHACAICHKKTP